MNVLSTWAVRKENSGGHNYLFFVLWPLFSFVHAVRHLEYRSSGVIIVFFYGLSGYFFPFAFTDNVDVVRHAERFLLVAELPFSAFLERLASLYISETNKPDIAQALIEFVVSRVTGDYRIYFAVLGMILGYLLYKVTMIFYRSYDSYRNVYSMLFIFLIFTLIPPYRLASFRHYGALFIFIIAAYHVLVKKDNRYNVLAVAAVLVHFGFFGILPFYFLCLAAGNRYWIYFILIGLCFLAQDEAPALIGGVGDELQGEFSHRVRGYSSSDYIEYISDIKQNRNSFIDNQLRWTSYLLFALLLFYIRKIRKSDPGTQALYALSLSVFAFLMLVMNLETTFVRFSLVYIAVVGLVFVRLLSIHRVVPSLVYRGFFILILAFNVVIMVRKTIEFTGVQILVPNLFAAFLVDSNESVLDIMRNL